MLMVHKMTRDWDTVPRRGVQTWTAAKIIKREPAGKDPVMITQNFYS